MKTTMSKCGCIVVTVAMMLAGVLLVPVAMAEVVCDPGFTQVMAEPEPVDFTCVSDFVMVVDSTVNVLDGAEMGTLLGGGASVINIYGGIISSSLTYETTCTVTVFAATLDPIAGILDEGQTLIINGGSGVMHFTLTGTYLDGTTLSIPFDLESGASVGLNAVQTAPDIDVLPASGTHDYGQIEIGQAETYLVRISNVGNADLEVTSISLGAAGSTDFVITSAPTVPFTVVPEESLLVDVEVTYTPSAEGAVSTTVLIASDDEDEPVTEITLLAEGILPPAPEIVVYPELLEHDFGDVEIGQTQTYVAQILNIGTADLTVTELALDVAGSTDFSITSAPEVPFTVAPSESITVDIEIAYTPATEGFASTALTIGSDDEDEPVVEVAFGGVGIVVEIPPEQQIQAILDFIDASVADGTLIAYGPGNHPERRLRALKHMVRSAGTLIEAGYPNWAVCVLRAVDRKTDGERRPPDFVVGEATETLNTMVNDLIDDLTTE